jgi:cobalt transporter subunit CbtA
MALLGRILLPAILAGLIVGAFLTGLQHIEIIPLIYEAETYEIHAASGHAHDADASAAPAIESWAPEDGLERVVYTLLANIVATIGFGLLLSVAFVTLAAKGRAIVWRAGLLWGLAGFAIFNFAPALGLPPELPGSQAAALEERQGWWILTVLLTALGLGLIAFTRPLYLRALGGIALIVPHLIGAPAPVHHGGLAPEALAERFVLASLATSAAFWLALGALTAFLHQRIGGRLPSAQRH